jgi:hypothetical protein
MTVPAKRPYTDISGDAEVGAKNPKISVGARGVSFKEATLSQPSTPIIDLTGDDGEYQLSAYVEMPDKEPKFSKGARKTASSWTTPIPLPIQIVDLTDDDIDLDRPPPRTTPACDLAEECDKPQRERLVVYDPTCGRDKLRLERMAYDPVEEESNELQPISSITCDLANETKPRRERKPTYDSLNTHDRSVPEEGSIYDLTGKHNEFQPEPMYDLANKRDEPRHEQVLAYDTCFGLVYS